MNFWLLVEMNILINGISLIEWGEMIEDILPSNSTVVSLTTLNCINMTATSTKADIPIVIDITIFSLFIFTALDILRHHLENLQL